MKFRNIVFGIVLLLSGGILADTVDEAGSYFTVSHHDAPLGTQVQIRIFLYDRTGNPIQAKKVTIQASSPAVEVVSVPVAAPGKPGEYCASLRASVPVATDVFVIADGTEVQENVLADGSFEQGKGYVPAHVSTYANHYDSVYFVWENRPEYVFRGKKSLGAINFDPTKSIYWGFASFKKENMLLRHAYIFSIYACYDHIAGERGVSIVTSQQDVHEKFLGNKYAGFRAGNSTGWVKIQSEPVRPLKNGVSLGASAIILVAGGEVHFDAARVQLAPTVCWGDFPAAKAIPEVPKLCLIHNIGYGPALEKDLALCQNELRAAEKNCGTAAPGITTFRNALERWGKAVKTRLSAYDAYTIKLEMQSLRAQIKKTTAAAAENTLDRLLGD